MFEIEEIEREMSEAARDLGAEGTIEELFELSPLPVNSVRSAREGPSPCAHEKGWRVKTVRETAPGVGNLLLVCDKGCGAQRIKMRVWIRDLIFAKDVAFVRDVVE